MTKLKEKAIWILCSSAFAAICQLALLAFMARMLSAEHLGLYALILVLINLAMVVQDGGISAYLVHKQQLPATLLNTLFVVCLLFGVVVALCIILSAPWLAWYYQQPLLIALLKPVAITLLLSSIISPYQAVALIHGKQQQLAKYDMVSRCLGLVMALIGLPYFGLYAVLYAGVFSCIIKLILLAQSTEKRYKPGLSYSTSGLKPALKYGFYQTSALIINQLRTRSDQLIIGKLMGLEVLAVYSLAKELINHPTRFITPVIQNVLFPALAGSQQAQTEQKIIMAKSTTALTWSNTLIFSTMSVMALPIVWVLYGKEYSTSAGILSILCCYGMLRTIGASYVSYAQAEGRADLEFIWNVLAGMFMLFFVWLASLSHSIYITAAAVTASQLALSFLGFYFFSKALPNLLALRFYRITLWPIVITLGASILGYWLYA